MAQKDLWVAVLRRLQPTIKKAHFLTWFQNTTVLGKNGADVLVGVPTIFAHNWVTGRYSLKIEQAVKELDPAVETVSYEVRSGLADDPTQGGVDVKSLFASELDKKVRKVRNSNEVMVSRGAAPKVGSGMLNDRYRLDNFVVGSDNRLPHAACQAVAHEPGGIYNPLYIYGSSGLGKTHLIQSIGNQVVRTAPDLIVKYLTAERFVTEVVDAIGKRYMKKFKEQFRNVDCFLLDDVQFFARKDSSQQEFFHTFDELYDHNKQIVITSDRAPSDLDGLDDRLKSRFSMGMVVELLLPDFETRLAILQQKCREFQMLVDPDILSFIAGNVTTSVRELEGVLRQILADTQLFDRVPTIRSVAEIIQRMNRAQKIIGYDLEGGTRPKCVRNSYDVMNIVAEYYGMSVDQLLGKDRHRDIMLPRQICMYIIKNELGESYEKIGVSFGGRNHTTVMHACNKTSAILKNDVKIMRDLNAIRREMGL